MSRRRSAPIGIRQAGNRQAGSSGLRRRYLLAWLEQHREVATATLKGLLKQPLGTLMTLAAVAIALALPTTLSVALHNVKRLGGDWQRSAAVSVFLEAEVDEAQGAQLRQRLQQLPEVETATLVSRAEGLAEFRDYSGLGAALDQLPENPLPVVIELQVQRAMLAPATLSPFITRVDALTEVDFVREDAQWAQRFNAIVDLLRTATALLALLLGLGALLVIGNTIRLEIENHRDEIQIMALVGATPRFARRRFLYIGAWYGLIGGTLAAMLVTLLVWLLASEVASLAAVYHKSFNIRGLSAAQAAMLLLGGALLGIIGSWIAVSRHLGLSDGP
ncbi:permease-like cell division protein FtsX [Halochromatium sp.]